MVTDVTPVHRGLPKKTPQHRKNQAQIKLAKTLGSCVFALALSVTLLPAATQAQTVSATGTQAASAALPVITDVKSTDTGHAKNAAESTDNP
jgi:uncharacterized membrane protein